MSKKHKESIKDKKGVLDFKILTSKNRGDPKEFKEIKLNSSEINEISDDIRSCISVTKLDLSENQIIKIDQLGYLKTLQWINLSSNNIEDIRSLKHLKNLKVANLSKNKIISVDGLQHCKNLKAVILNDNEISNANLLISLTELNSLVLSRNKLKDDLNFLDSLVNLKKLSLTGNGIQKSPSFKNNKNLQELRLNDNKLIKIPSGLHELANLVYLDISKNRISSINDLESIKGLKNLINLNVKDNPVSEIKTKEGRIEVEEKIIRWIPLLENLNLENTFYGVWRRKVPKNKKIEILKSFKQGKIIDPSYSKSFLSFILSLENKNSSSSSKLFDDSLLIKPNNDLKTKIKDEKKENLQKLKYSKYSSSFNDTNN